MPKAVFTIVSSNYLHFARTLMQGLGAAHPDCDRFCVLVDTDPSYASAYQTEFEIVRLEEIGLPEPRRFAFRYTILELNTAVKPWAFEHLFARGYSDVVYIDPDIRVYRPLTEVFALLQANADIVVTPHLLAPIDDANFPDELHIRRAGTYNFGFCALARRPGTFEFLHWWREKLVYGCVVDLAAGIFVDQSWIDLVPGMFPNVAILRHPGYNVAYWNLAQRTIERGPGGWTVNGQPLTFFHFSGFDPDRPEPFSKHQNRYTLDTLGPARTLALDYATALVDNDARTLRTVPYGYGAFSDGTAIPDVFRRRYRVDRELEARMGDDPFAHPEMLWAVPPEDAARAVAPTYLMRALWNARADLQGAFAIEEDAGVARYLDWIAAGGASDWPPAIVESHARLRVSPPVAAPVVAIAPATMHEDPLPARRDAGAAVDRLFAALLGRRPEADARARYAMRFGRAGGPVSCLLAIGLSRESRARAGLVGRLARGARLALGLWALGSETAAPNATTSAAAGGEPRLRAARGWSVKDGDIAAAGIWTAPEASLPCHASPGLALVVEGTYFADPIEQQTGSRTCELTFDLDGRVIASTTLADAGPFVLNASLPADVAGGLADLRIRSSQHFIPHEIGLNDDRRALSWRASRVALGAMTLLDATRTPPILPIDSIATVEGINLVGYLAAESGVGESVRSFARACRAVGLRYGTYDVGYQNRNRQRDRSLADLPSDERGFSINVLHVNADQTPATLAALPAAHREAGTTIAYWHWEQPELPLSSLEAFEGLTEVWVPSGFVRDAVAAIAPVPVFKVPHAIEFPIAAEPDRARFGLPTDRFLVLTMYDFDSYQYRKNPQAAIEAFRRGCGARRDAGLVIKTINADRHPEGHRELRDAVAGLDAVVLLDRYLDRSDVHALEQACDCFLSLHRSEGFGLALAEMMFLGKPVVGTGWSGNMEFMTPMNSFPVEYELRPLAARLGAYEAGQPWAEADVDHAAHILAALAESDDLRRRVGDAGRADIREKFSAAAIGARYLRRLRLLAGREHANTRTSRTEGAA